jgi:hypothetical protein
MPVDRTSEFASIVSLNRRRVADWESRRKHNKHDPSKFSVVAVQIGRDIASTTAKLERLTQRTSIGVLV